MPALRATARRPRPLPLPAVAGQAPVVASLASLASLVAPAAAAAPGAAYPAPAAAASQPARTFAIDGADSERGFHVRRLVHRVTGTFRDRRGSITVADAVRWETAVIDVALSRRASIRSTSGGTPMCARASSSIRRRAR
jgi:hypothetical protein